MKTFGILVFSLFQLTSGSALSDLAGTMKAKEWKELKTIGLTSSLLSSGGIAHVFQYNDDATWDYKNQKLYFIGGGHAEKGNFLSYTAADNTWREEPKPAFAENLGHGYDHNAIDVEGGVFYHHPMGNRLIV